MAGLDMLASLIKRSDLDGDEYTVIWNQELVLNVRRNEEPMNFPSPTFQTVSKLETSREITTDDMIDFLVNYIKNDKLGQIGTAHLVMADKEGLNCLGCQELATKFSLAVDFVKSGQSTTLTPTERPKTYPDFMEKGNHVESYKSKKILGKLYRICREFEKVNELANCNYNEIEIDSDLVYPGWEKYEEDAVRCRNNYNILIQTILQQYGIHHECEAIAGAFLHLQDHYLERNERSELEKVVIHIMKTIWTNTEKEFLREFIENADSKILNLDAIYQKASAWYIVTYREKSAIYLSFPWTISKYLLHIKANNCAIMPAKIEKPILSIWDIELEKMDLKVPSVPDSLVDELLNKYSFVVPGKIIERALAVIVQWARNKSLVQTSEDYHWFYKFMPLENLVREFFHAAYASGYVKKNNDTLMNWREADEFSKNSPSSLCLIFLKYCMSFRFQSKEMCSGIRTHKELAKYATYAYHNLAVTASLEVLDVLSDSKLHNDDQEVEMEPKRLSILVSMSRSSNSADNQTLSANRIKKCLMKWSGVSDVQIRNEDKYAIVSATGSSFSVRILERILSKDIIWLSMAFRSGNIPGSVTPWK